MDDPKFTDEWEWKAYLHKLGHPKNFTEEEWKEYLDKIYFLLPMNDKEWAEWSNPKAKFYPKGFYPNVYYSSIKFQIHRDFDLTKFK